MVFINTGDHDAADLSRRLEELGVRLLQTGTNTLRAVTNLTVSNEEIDDVLKACVPVFFEKNKAQYHLT